eukprot:3948368-Prymnesium_polylepis.2
MALHSGSNAAAGGRTEEAALLTKGGGHSPARSRAIACLAGLVLIVLVVAVMLAANKGEPPLEPPPTCSIAPAGAYNETLLHLSPLSCAGALFAQPSAPAAAPPSRAFPVGCCNSTRIGN